MRKRSILIPGLASLLLAGPLAFAAETSAWKGSAENVWASEGVAITPGTNGLKVSFGQEGWQGVAIPAWGQLENQAAVRFVFGPEDNAELSKVTVRVKNGLEKNVAEQGPVLKLKDYPARAAQGGLVVDIPLANCAPNKGAMIWGVSLSSMTAAEVTLVEVLTIDDATFALSQKAKPVEKKPRPSSSGPMLIDFNTELKKRQLVVEKGRAAVIDGALQLDAAPGEHVKIRLRPATGHWNLWDYVNLTLDLENATGQEAWLRILIKDPTTKDESWYRPNLSHNAWVRPGETRLFDALLVRHRYKGANPPDYIDRFPKMYGLPHAQMLVWYGVDVTRVSEVVISLEPKDGAQSVRIDNVRGSRRASPELLETDPDAFFPFIDVYGQYMHEDWPGKVKTDADLIAAKKAEERDLAAHPRPKSFNKYGGWADGPTLKATGHFRTEKVNGKWWFVDPEGKLFWSLGCTGVGLQTMLVDLSVKRHFYDGLPEASDPVFGKYYANGGDDYKSLSVVLHKKHGADFANTYNDRALRRIRSWSLNTLGAWSLATGNPNETLKTPYTKIIWIPGEPIGPIQKLDDPFDAGFSEAVAQAVRRSGAKDDPYCIGLFCNNEIAWGVDPAKVSRDIVRQCGSDVAAKVELVEFMKAKYGSVANANAAWESSFKSWDDLLLPLGGSFNYPKADDALFAFHAHLADAYYRRTRAAIKSVAPDKLYIGSRIHDNGMRKEVTAAAARHCDVVSFNVYEKDLTQFNIRAESDQPFFIEDKPFIVGEFDFGALDRGKFFTGIGFAADQRNRGENYVNYIKSGLRNPRCVGAHWFNYTDSPTASRYKDSENANCGLVGSTDSPYPELITAIRSVGPMMYGFRYESGRAR